MHIPVRWLFFCFFKRSVRFLKHLPYFLSFVEKSSSQCGVLFPVKVENDAVAWGAEQPIYNTVIMADLRPGNLQIGRTIKERHIVLECKHFPVPKGMYDVFIDDISWEMAYHTIIV